MSGHTLGPTPGPWSAKPWSHDDNAVCVFKDSALIARVCYLGGTAQAEANARLIAAAPDLLETLKEARGWLHSAYDEYAEMGDPDRKPAYIYDAVRPVKQRIDAAIAAATATRETENSAA